MTTGLSIRDLCDPAYHPGPSPPKKRVELLKDLPMDGLLRGARGTVVKVYLRDENEHVVQFDGSPARHYTFGEGDFHPPISTLRYIE